MLLNGQAEFEIFMLPDFKLRLICCLPAKNNITNLPTESDTQ